MTVHSLDREFDQMRVGAVSYLNTKPLIEGLASQLGSDQFVLDLPSRLADRLASSELDVALIPVIEAISNPNYMVVSDACIACRGPVWSVKLLARKPFERVKTMAIDEGSRTSVALSQVLLHRRFKSRPELHPFPIGADPRNVDEDAVLIIGDRAMKDYGDTFPYQWDLGEQWIQETGLPFVFAVWTARVSSSYSVLDSLLSEARDRGVEAIDEIAADQAPLYQLTQQVCQAYLTQNLHFHLGSDEREGLSSFLQQCQTLGLIEDSHELTYYDCQTTR